MKQLRRFCPHVEITANRNVADYLILHERQAGGTFGGNRNNVAAFGRDDVLVYADGATQLDNSVKDLCESDILTGGTLAGDGVAQILDRVRVMGSAGLPRAD